MTVQWLPVSHHPLTGHPYNYTVQWAAHRGGSLGATSNVTVTGASYIIVGLNAYTNYVIRVAAKDRNEEGNLSDPVWMQTKEGGNVRRYKRPNNDI